MKYLTFINGDNLEPGVLSVCETKIYPLHELGIGCKTLQEFIENTSKSELQELDKTIKGGNIKSIPLNAVKLVAPIPNPPQIAICTENNYVKSLEEKNEFMRCQADGKPQYPTYYFKKSIKSSFDNSNVSSYADYVEELDYGCELALVTLNDMKNVKEEDVHNHIFGYTIVNNFIARDVYEQHKRPYLGVSLDGFFSMGPWIVTADEFEYPLDIKLSSKLNGEVRQCAGSSLMKFGIERMVSELSHNSLLKAGTIFLTGTPQCNDGDVPRYLKAGDVVECEIENIGRITNTIG